MKGWLDKYNDGGPVQPNYNDASVSMSDDFVGMGNDTTGRNYSPAWGGQFKPGGKIPFDQWYKTVPKAKNDTINYNLRRAYELAPQKELDAFVKDPNAHLMTAYENPQTGIYEFMKSKHHSTINKELDWYNGKGGKDFRNNYDLDTSGDFYRYVPKQFEDGGFLQPNSYKLPKGIKVPYADSSSELAMSIGGEGGEPAYLIPSFKYGQPLKNPIAEYMLTGEHLGGPFKTWQEADKWEQDIRHPYVEKGQAIPTPIKTWGDMAMGGSMPGAVGFTYARTIGPPAPSKGPHGKKTVASAENGMEMKYYQNGLDFKPKSISKDGSKIDPSLFIGKNPKTFGKNVAAPMSTSVNKVLPTDPTKLTTQAQRDAQEAKERRNRINVANAVQDQEWSSPENFAISTSAIADKLRYSDAPNSFDDSWFNPIPMIGHGASALGKVPLNIKQGNYGQAALDVAAPLAFGTVETLLSPVINKVVGKGIKSARTLIDQNFTQVGKQLAQIEAEGLAKGLSSHEIKMNQMDQVGITSAQREAYVPGVSDLLYKYVRPQGYSGMGGESKLAETLNLIKKGGVEYSEHSSLEDYMSLEDMNRDTVVPPREDAWRLYLGKPQKHGTFEMSQTAPIQHPSYTPEQLSNLDLYSIKSNFGKHGLFPGYNVGDGKFNNFDVSSFNSAIPYLENPINVQKSHIIMGGHNKRLSQAGLEYNDIWDLNPTVAPINFLPSKLKPKFADSPLFVNKDSRGIESLREIQIPIDKFVGKPFMTHGVEQGLTSDKVVNDVKGSLVKYLDRISKNREEDLIKMKANETPKQINELWDEEEAITNDRLRILENYPKFKEGGALQLTKLDQLTNFTNYNTKQPGGWLDKYQ